MRRFVCITMLILSSLPMLAQKADLRRGNRQFKKEKYAEADISYRKGLMQDSTSVAAKYNLAGNLYRQGNFDEAAKFLDSAAGKADATGFAADYYFNRGDVAIAKEDWQAAVSAFEKCLLANPEDLAAKENYIYARNKLAQQQQEQNQDQQQNQQNQDGQQNQDQNQNNQDQQEQQNQDQNQDQNSQQDQQNQEQQPQEAKPQPLQQQLSPQQAQQLLQAIRDKERETQEKVDQKKAAALKSRQKDKNW